MRSTRRSLRAIARRAGVSHAAPKYYFSDRAALLTAVAAQGFTEPACHLVDVFTERLTEEHAQP